MSSPFIFVEAAYGCDQGRLVTRAFAHPIWSTAERIWDNGIFVWAVLKREIIFAELVDPSCESF